MSQRDTIIHLVAGGIAGTNGAVLTCPLEVVKTRLQSSNPVFGKESVSASKGYRNVPPLPPHSHSSPKIYPSGKDSHNSRPFSTCASCGRSAQILAVHHHGSPIVQPAVHKIGLIQCLRLIIEKEGPGALFRGLGPNLVGVAPSRAIYFSAYSSAKKQFNDILPPDSPVVHLCSAATAGFVASTATNPIWFVKTRLQLESERGFGTKDTIRRIYAQGGILGFYKGISASYMGISETMIHFVIYEAVKKRLQEWNAENSTLKHNYDPHQDKTSKDFLQFMAAGAFSKTIAACIAYPHEVARTRLREEGNKYHHLVQTLCLVAKEEGYRGLYRGLATQLIRQIPNTAIMMSTYEAAVYILTKSFPPPPTAPRGHDFDDSYDPHGKEDNHIGS